MINVADGNDMDQLKAAFDEAKATKGMPTAIIMKTVKGKGFPSWKTRLDGMAKLRMTSSMHRQWKIWRKVGEALCQK